MDQIRLHRFFEVPELKNKLKKDNRLFLPLDERWYRLFYEGKKCWELRGINGIFNLKTIKEGRTVELRRGYKSDPLWGIITDRLEVRSIDQIPEGILNETIPVLVRDDPEVRSFLTKYGEKYNSFILFKIKIVEGIRK